MPGATRGRKRTSTAAGIKNGTPTSSTQNDTKRQKVFHRSHQKRPGSVLAVGDGDVGQLGMGVDVLEKSRPGKVNLPEDMISVVAGGMHTVCLTAKGEVYTFGCNDEGALGRDTSEEGSETLPAKVTLADKIVQISAGDSHTAALTDDGRVIAWGNFRDANGPIGLTTEGLQKTPIELINNEVIVKIASGSDHLVCLTIDGDVLTLGNSEQGQLGRVAECFSYKGGRKGLEYILKPGKVHFKKPKGHKTVFSDVWAGTYDTFVQLKETGEIYGWGLNNYYQLGLGDLENRFTPVRIDNFTNSKDWQCVASGQHHTIALDGNGKVYSCGRATYGRLGLGDSEEEAQVPTLVNSFGNQKCVDISVGSSCSFAVTDDGTIYSWGMGSNQLGAGSDEEDLRVPTKMLGKQLENRSGISISAGGQHTVILAKDKQ